MTLGEINSKITALTGASTDSYPNSDRVIDLNATLHNVVGMILDSQDESDFDDPRHGDLPVLTTPLTLNRDYGIPQAEAMLQMKRVDITYDGTNWYQATPLDSSEMNIGLGNDDVVDNGFTKSQPYYDIMGTSVLIYPRASQADIDAGATARFEWYRAAADFTSAELVTGTAIPGVDKNFHMMLAYGTALEYCSQNHMEEKATRYQKKFDDYEARLRRQYGSKQKDRHLTMKSYYGDSDFE